MNEDLARRLRLCTTLPTPPATAIKIIELANDPGTSLMQIADCVAFDPALAAKLLKVANSPLYNMRRAAGNIRQAVSLMGTHTAITIALSFSLARSIKSSTEHADQTLFWRRSILAALACRSLGKRLGLPGVDDLLLAGLMQDIGVLAMATIMPDEYTEIYDAAADHDALLRIEKERFGSGHDEVGYWLLKRWNLPDNIALCCLTSHSTPPKVAAPPNATACVAVSGYLADAFLKPGDAVATLKAEKAVRFWFALDSHAFIEVMDMMRSGMQEVEELFDMSLLDAAEADAIVAEAKELLFVSNLGKFRELEEKSQRDALTGAYNRMYFDESFRQEFALSTRHAWPLSIAFIDIDYFKQINDTYGHAIGDNALKSLTRLILAQIRNGDIFARYGGEEFVLIFPGTLRESAEKVLQRVRDTIATFGYPVDEDSTFNMTISVGLAYHMDGGVEFRTAEEMLGAADQALYAAKRAGRNRIAVASHLPATPEPRP